MSKKLLLIATMTVAVAAAAFPTRASAGDPVAGALIGGGIGAAVGGPPGAAVGAVIGTIIGAESRPYYRRGYYRDEAYYEPRYRERGYYAPRYREQGYYAPPVARYYESAPVFYAPPPQYYAPEPVYYGPAIVYRSHPSYGYDRRYVRVLDHRHYRDERRWR